MDGPALDFSDLAATLEVGHFDRCQILAFFSQHLDACIETLIVQRIVGDLLNIEVDGLRTRSLGIGRHLEFFVRGLLELRHHWHREHGDNRQECTI